jgi:hypothetical protein
MFVIRGAAAAAGVQARGMQADIQVNASAHNNIGVAGLGSFRQTLMFTAAEVLLAAQRHHGVAVAH